MNSILLPAVSAFSSSAQAQTLATFSGVDWTGPFIEERNYTLQWTIGNGFPVSANLQSENYSQPMFANIPASSVYVYTIPDPIAEGTYSMQLLQGGNLSDVSPLFSILMAPLNISTNATAAATATATAAAADATGTGIAGSTTYEYFDEDCGCTRTGLVPAVTGASTGANYTVPALTTPGTQPTTGTYTGAAIILQAAWIPSLLFGAVSAPMFA